MKIQIICYLKSGATIMASAQFDEGITVDEARDGREELENTINKCIKEDVHGTFTIGFTNFNISEVAAYTLTIEEEN